jgi:hypothetical protein
VLRIRITFNADAGLTFYINVDLDRIRHFTLMRIRIRFLMEVMLIYNKGFRTIRVSIVSLHASISSLYGSRLSLHGVILSLIAPQFRP